MLTELRIENFAIIQNLELKFGPGLITFTGETGAGKSILLDAIEAIVGGRADTNNIRSGADRAVIEAVFRLPVASRAEILSILDREELCEEEEYLTLGRELRREGRSVARVNGRTVSMSLLRELGEFLVDIHGQSEHLSLLNVRQHLGLLDRYAGGEALLNEFRQSYRRLVTLRRELRELRQNEKDATRRAELLEFQAQEIEAAHLREGEEETLKQERDRLANAESLATLTRQALAILEGATPELPAISDLLGRLVQTLNALARIDSSQLALAEHAGMMSESGDELIRALQDYLERLEFNPRRLEQVEERLELIHRLKRKYGGSVQAILAHGIEARQRLEDIAHAGERIQQLEEEEKWVLEQLAKQGERLSDLRRQTAERLAIAVERELDDLNMAGARFKVDIQQEADVEGVPVGEQRLAFDETGLDRVEFLIAPNPGEGFKPLVKTASGGETSRLMLALKNVLARADAIPTLIFDEIDQGIGGRVGAVVGEKLWRLGRQHQVLCVTHLPQLAAFGDQHFRVLKRVEGGRTQTIAEQLDDAARLDELAQMLGALNEENRRAAQATLEQARQRAKELSAAVESK